MKLRSAWTISGRSASWVIRSASASLRSRCPSDFGSGQVSDRRPADSRSFESRSTSRSTGAQIRTRAVLIASSIAGALVTSGPFLLGLSLAREDGNAREHAAELLQRSADLQPLAGDLQLPDGRLMCAAAFLDHGDRFPHFPVRLEVADQNHAVGEIADVDRRRHLRAEEPVLRVDENRRHAVLA